MKRKLLANRWQTPDGVILWSKHRHDYKDHVDKNGNYYYIDGGNEYCRGSLKSMKDLCVYSDGTFELEREWVLWGRNYTKDMVKLKETQWVPVKDLDTDHIYKILEFNIPDSYRRLFEEEIIFREQQTLKEYGINN